MIAFSIYFKSYLDVTLCAVSILVAVQANSCARRGIFRVSIRDSRGVDGSICDRAWRG
jgi:hypothetical protein